MNENVVFNCIIKTRRTLNFRAFNARFGMVTSFALMLTSFYARFVRDVHVEWYFCTFPSQQAAKLY